jgi:hypothetical protein
MEVHIVDNFDAVPGYTPPAAVDPESLPLPEPEALGLSETARTLVLEAPEAPQVRGMVRAELNLPIPKTLSPEAILPYIQREVRKRNASMSNTSGLQIIYQTREGIVVPTHAAFIEYLKTLPEYAALRDGGAAAPTPPPPTPPAPERAEIVSPTVRVTGISLRTTEYGSVSYSEPRTYAGDLDIPREVLEEGEDAAREYIYEHREDLRQTTGEIEYDEYSRSREEIEDTDYGTLEDAVNAVADDDDDDEEGGDNDND